MTLVATKITEALAARLRGCTAGAGCASDVGRAVHTGRVKASAPEAPCIILTPGRGSDEGLYGAVEHTRVYELRGFADANDHPALSDCDLVDQIIWDIRRTIEGQGIIPGAVSVRYRSDAPGFREEGGTLVGAFIEYEVTYSVDLNDPSNPL